MKMAEDRESEGDLEERLYTPPFCPHPQMWNPG